MHLRFPAWILLFCLGITLPILGATYLTEEEALGLAFKNPKEARLVELVLDDHHLRAVEKILDEKFDRKKIRAFTGVLKDGGTGAVLFDSVIGKHEPIDYMVVLDSKGAVKFIEILAYRESYGGQVRGKNWRKQFEGKSTGKMPVHQENITNISGATLSSRHVTDAVRGLLAAAKVYSKKLGLED